MRLFNIKMPVQALDLTKLKEGDIVDLGASGKFILNPDGTFSPVSPQQPQTELTETAEQKTITPAVIAPASSGEIAGLQAKLETEKTSAFPQTTATTADQNKYFFVKEGTNVRYFDSQGNELSTNPLGGDQFRLNPEQTPGFEKGNLVQLAAPPSKTMATQTGLATFGLSPELTSFFGGELSRLDEEHQQAERNKAELDAISQRLDSLTAGFVQNIRSRYASLIEEQKRLNNAFIQGLTQTGIRAGRARYAPDEEMANINAEVRNGLDRIKKLEDEREALILQAETSNEQGKYDRLYKAMNMLDENRARNRQAVLDLFNTINNLEKTLQERNKLVQQALQDRIKLATDTVNSIAYLADATLSAFEENDDLQGGSQFIKDLANQYGVDPNLLLSKVQEIRSKEKAFGEPFNLPGVGLVQRNFQTGEIRSLSVKEREQIVIDPLTGQPRVFRLGVTGAPEEIGGVPGGIREKPAIPPQIQAAIGVIGNIQYIDESRLTSRQVPIAQNLATQLGIPFVSSEDAKAIKTQAKDVSSAISLLNTIRNLARKVITAKNVVERIQQGITLKLEQLKGENPDVVSFFDAIEAFSSLLTRAAGEKGVLTNLDINRIKKALPKSTQTVQAMENNLLTLQDLFESNLDGAIRAYLNNLGVSEAVGSFSQSSGVTQSGLKYTIEQ